MGGWHQSGVWEKLKFRIGIRWLWLEKHGTELLSRPKLKQSSSAKKNKKFSTASKQLRVILLTGRYQIIKLTYLRYTKNALQRVLNFCSLYPIV